MAKKPKPPELIGGPYVPPPHELGSILRCRIRGRLKVAGLTDAPIQWPFAWQGQGGGKRLMIVTTELAQAIRTESTSALCHWFGVSRSLVRDWKVALKVPRVTPGALKLLRAKLPERLGYEAMAKGGRAASAARVENRRKKRDG